MNTHPHQQHTKSREYICMHMHKDKISQHQEEEEEKMFKNSITLRQ